VDGFYEICICITAARRGTTKYPMKIIESTAEFNAERTARFSLWRIWDRSKPLVMFIGLNPSTANETDNDPTIKRVIAIAAHNGYGGICMANCWSFISTNPDDLIPFAVNLHDTWREDIVLKQLAAKCQDVVFAWGNFKIVKETGRDKEIMQMFPRAYALHINKNGSPKHPLFCRADTKFLNFNNSQT
jgi:hypothetical protein